MARTPLAWLLTRHVTPEDEVNGQRFAARGAICSAAVALALATGGTAHAEDDIDSLTAEQISDRARDALLAAKSLHLSTRGDLGEPGAPTSMDLSLDRDGNCAGAMRLGKEGSVEIIKRGGTVWMKPDEAFWKSQIPGGGSAVAELIAGRYLKGSAGDSMLKGLAEVCDLDSFQKMLTDNPKIPRTDPTKGKKTKLDGDDVIPLTTTSQGRKLTMYVAAAGKPYPLRLQVEKSRTDSTPATVSFSDFDKPVPSKTPPPDETVDLSALRDQVG